jgi:hypothetical protein
MASEDYFRSVSERDRNQFICATSVRINAKMAVVYAGGRHAGLQ